MNLRRTRAIARKELIHILRDPRSLIMALVLPLMMILLFGYALTLDIDRIPVSILDQDHSPQSRDLIAAFTASSYFQIVEQVDGYPLVEKAIDENRALVGLVIPQDYARKLLTGQTTPVQLILDGSDSNTASIALGYSRSVILSQNLAIRLESQNRKTGIRPPAPVENQVRIWYNSELKSRNFIIPGLIGLILMIIAALLTSLTIAREWETGTMEQLISTPVRPIEVVLGKMAAFSLLGIADTVTAVLAGVGIFRIPFRGSLLFLAAICLLFVIGSLGWGILISAMTRNQLMAYQLGLLTSFLPAFLLSGFVFAIENMPLPVQAITYLFPTRYFISILRGIFLKGVGAEVLWLEILFLFLYSGVVVFLASKKAASKVA